jgi:hypothetical protein
MKKEQIYLLKWLAKEDSSALGECFGSSFDYLYAEGYVTVKYDVRPNYKEYSRVSLTEKGWEKVKEYADKI